MDGEVINYLNYCRYLMRTFFFTCAAYQVPGTIADLYSGL